MSTDEQQDSRTSGSVPNAFGNALSWKWTRQMSAYLRRSGLPLLLCQLRNLANASGDVAFASDRRPIRIQDIAKAACANEKDTRRYLEAAIRAGVVTTRGERKRGVPTLYVLLVHPFPDWQAAEDYLKTSARKPGKRPAAWSEETESSGHRDPNQYGSPRPELTDGTPAGDRVTATRMGSGHRDPLGSGHRGPNNPGVSHDSSHDGAEVVPQPQVVGPAGPQDQAPQEHTTTPSAPPAAAIAGRCRECSIPLIRPGRDLCHGCETYLTTTGRHTA